MISIDDVKTVLNKMIFSASGWRGIFAGFAKTGELEESASPEISEAHRIITGAAAIVFAEFLQNSVKFDPKKPEKTKILLGCDTRPTGKAIIDVIIPALISMDCEVHFAGYTAAPEIMSWARFCKSVCNDALIGFIYISASHNPIGHNGFKFGLADGGVLQTDEAAKLISDFRKFMDRDDCIEKIENQIRAANPAALKKVYAEMAEAKQEAFNSYYDFCGEVADNGVICNSEIIRVLKGSLSKQHLGVVCDFNGSARTVSIDKKFFCELGLKFKSINDKPGEIVHRIVPEGESLEPCRKFLEAVHAIDPSFVLGYVPDCDGDRGNLVIWDDAAYMARPLAAQEVFALACVAEFAHLTWTGELPAKAAIAINDPTSMRVDRIAEAFGVSVFRAEVGEANVVELARNLRKEGYIVRILGEGSAGGNITHPSAVRDPMHTVLAIVKLLSVRSGGNANKPGLFEIWCRLSGQQHLYREDFTLSDIIGSLPKFSSTPGYSPDAIMQIKTQDHSLLKNRYQRVFLRDWEKQKNELKELFGIEGWEVFAYNGTIERRGLTQFGEAGKGGLKISFLDSERRSCAYIWMRGSATEPVFRIMVDCVRNTNMENFLLNWQRRMISEADKE